MRHLVSALVSPAWTAIRELARLRLERVGYADSSEVPHGKASHALTFLCSPGAIRDVVRTLLTLRPNSVGQRTVAKPFWEGEHGSLKWYADRVHVRCLPRV